MYMKILRENILSLIHNHKTLGGRSNFEYALEKGQLYIRFGKMTNFLSVKEDWIKKVYERINKLKENEVPKYNTQTSLYNKKLWDECPNNRVCPYVACLIIHKKIYNK